MRVVNANLGMNTEAVGTRTGSNKQCSRIQQLLDHSLHSLEDRHVQHVPYLQHEESPHPCPCQSLGETCFSDQAVRVSSFAEPMAPLGLVMTQIAERCVLVQQRAPSRAVVFPRLHILAEQCPT